MPTKFQDLVSEFLDPFVDDHYGEPFTLRPMTAGSNGRPAPDPARAVVTAIGVLHEARAAALEVGNRDGRGNDFRSLVNSPGYDLLVDRRRLPQGAQQGDEVEIRGDRHQVASARFDGVSRWELRLVK